jgi:hypothetical protein
MPIPLDLKAAIEHLRKAISGPEREKIRVAIQNHSLSAIQLKEALPEDLAVLLPILLLEKVYTHFYEHASPKTKKKLDEARPLAEEHFGDFARHPAIQRSLAELVETLSSVDDCPSIKQNLSVVIGRDTYWKDVDGKIAPLMRLAFLGPVDKSSVVMIADPIDLLVLSGNLLNIAVSEFERCIPMAENEMLEFPNADKVSQFLRSIEEELQKLRELAPKLGIDLSQAVEDEEK